MEQETDKSFCLVLFSDSDLPPSASRACFATSSNQNKEFLLSASGSEELGVGDDEQAATELLHKEEQSVAFKELLEVAKLS